MRWCRELGLPIRLEDLGKLDMSHLQKAAEKACDPNDSMANMPFPVTPNMVTQAMREVDLLATKLG
jgi:glycerol dehydrogenase